MARRPSVCPQLPPAPPVPPVVSLTLPPNPALPQPESKNLRIILQSIRAQDALEVQTWGCASLRDLAREVEDRAWLGRLGGIELVLNAMRCFPAETQLQEAACGALATLSYENPNNSHIVLQHGGIELLLRAMHLHYTLAPLQGFALCALRMLCSSEEARQHLVRLGGIDTAMAALANHRDVMVQGSGCGLLGRLAASCAEDLQSIAARQGVHLAVAALTAVPRDADVQACACALLGNLVLEVDVEAEAVELVVAALQHESLEVKECAVNALNNVCLRSPGGAGYAAAAGAYAALAAVQASERMRLLSCSVMHLLCSQDTGVPGDFVEHGGLPELLVTMRDFTSYRAQEQMASVLHRLGSDYSEQIWEDDGLAVIMRAMGMYPDSVKIQAAGCFLTAQWTRGGSAAAKTRAVVGAGAVERVVHAMARHLQEVEVQELGCCMLRHVAEHGGREPISLGGVEAALQCLQAHPEELGVQEQAVKTLACLGEHEECRIRVVDYGKEVAQVVDEREVPAPPPPREQGLRGKEVELWTLWGKAAAPELVDMEQLEVHPEAEAALAVVERGLVLVFRSLRHGARDIHRAACAFLARLAADGESCQAQVLQHGGLLSALSSAALHPEEPEVQVEAFRLLQNLLVPGGGSLVPMATSTGAVELILHALRRFPQHAEVLRTSAELLRSLVAEPVEEKTLAKNLEEAVVSLEGFAEALRVETLLQELRRYSADVATRSTALGIVELFMEALKTFSHDAELQEVILMTYRELAANRRSRHRMTMRGTWKEIMADVQAHRDRPALQVFGCDLMELQTRDCEHDNIEDAIVFGGVESLLKVFEYHAQDLNVQERSCVAAAKLAGRSEDVKAMFVEGHLIQHVVHIMGLHRGSAKLQHLACLVLLSLLDTSCAAEMVESNCLEAACAALEAHLSHGELQSQALQLLAALAESVAVRARLAEAEGLVRVLHAMQVCVDSKEVQRDGCHLLASWGEDDPRYFQKILDAHGPTAVVAGMQRHVEQRAAQEEATELLRLIALRSQEGRDKVIAAGGIEAILDGMNANRKSDELAFRGCASMAILAKGDRSAVARIAKHQGAKHLVRAMLVSRERADLQESALEALRVVSADDEDVPGQITSNGGVQFVCQALTDFKHFQSIQEHGLAALANLAWDSTENQVQIGELGACEHAVEVLSLHAENSKVQAFACALLQSVACNNPEMRIRIGEIGGVEAIVEAMRQDMKAANVQAFGASALQSLATQNQDNVRRCHKLKVVDFVADAIEAHPYSLKLREFGEMLINTIEG